MLLLITITAASISSLLLAGVATASTPTIATESNGDYVVLLHGAGRTALSMKRVESYLSKQGYRVINKSYPSNRTSVADLADNWLAQLLQTRITDTGAKVHFVTHSLGGILVRQYLTNHRLDNLGRVVMLGPPNHGSEVVDHLNSHRLSRKLLGSSRRELGTSEMDLPKRLGPVWFDCGIIAGDRSSNPLLSWMLPRPNDGKVSVASACVEGMRDFTVVHSTHTWMMWRPQVLRETLSFLKTGSFISQRAGS